MAWVNISVPTQNFCVATSSTRRFHHRLLGMRSRFGCEPFALGDAVGPSATRCSGSWPATAKQALFAQVAVLDPACSKRLQAR